MEEQIRGMVETIFAVGNIKDMLSSVSSVINAEVLVEAYSGVGNVAVTFGSFLMLLYFIIKMVDDFSIDRVTPQTIFSAFLKMAIALTLIEAAVNNFTIISGLDSIIADGISGVVATTDASNTSAMVDEIMEGFAEQTNNFNMKDSMLLPIQLAIPWLASIILSIYIKFVLYSRQIEILMKIIFAPIAMAGISEGLNGASINYIKKFFALMIQIGVIQVIMAVVGSASVALASSAAGGMTGGIGLLFGQVTVTLVASGMIGKSLRFSEEIIGAK